MDVEHVIAMANMTWVGGLRERANASWPLCRLRLGEHGVVLEPTWGWLGFLAPTYAFPWEQVAGVYPVQGALFGSGGIRFELKESIPATKRHWMARLWPRSATHPIFWCFPKRKQEEILRAIPPDLMVLKARPPRVVI